jgi:hypothetical protein
VYTFRSDISYILASIQLAGVEGQKSELLERIRHTGIAHSCKCSVNMQITGTTVVLVYHYRSTTAETMINAMYSSWLGLVKYLGY